MRSLSRVRFLIPALGLAIGLAGCAQIGDLLTALRNGVQIGGESRTGVYQIPWPTKAGALGKEQVQYHLQNVSIESYDNPKSLQGRYVQIYVDPYMNGDQLGGSEPVGRYIRNKNGVMVAMDYGSLQSAAIHAHFERLAALDQALGVSGLIRWPVKIGVRANVLDPKNGMITNNAVFDNRLNALLIMPYRDGAVPIAMNAGIIAHEHFHQLFQALVLDKLPKKISGTVSGIDDWLCTVVAPESVASAADPAQSGVAPSAPPVVVAGSPQTAANPRSEGAAAVPHAISSDIYNQFLVRGMNEGFADFWAWVYTGDPRFISQSLPLEDMRRRIDSRILRLPSEALLLRGLLDPRSPDRARSEVERISLAYAVGTMYARFLHELALEVSGGVSDAETTLDQRVIMAQALLDSLPALTDAISASEKQQTLLSPNAIIEPLSKSLAGRVGPESAAAACPTFSRLGLPGAVECGPRSTPSPMQGEAP